MFRVVDLVFGPVAAGMLLFTLILAVRSSQHLPLAYAMRQSTGYIFVAVLFGLSVQAALAASRSRRESPSVMETSSSLVRELVLRRFIYTLSFALGAVVLFIIRSGLAQ